MILTVPGFIDAVATKTDELRIWNLSICHSAAEDTVAKFSDIELQFSYNNASIADYSKQYRPVP